MTENKKFIIANCLSYGKENALSFRDLKSLFPKVSDRELRAQIERERNAGAPICAKKYDGGGYYLPQNEDEINEYLGVLGRGIITLSQTYKAIELSKGENKSPLNWQE